ncbi:TPA: type I 3-dehydroquinate dehydratase [Candidatus Bathyarchaeota archaeon]|nr:type I 3-dehydroquinate dehydratase [Candidatus Bathyarchaeota archaeon]
MVKICVSVQATTTAAAVEAIHGLDKPDLVELRLDYASERLNLEKLREATDAPLIATARTPSHGGRWAGDEEERQRLLISAAKTGFDYADVEADSDALDELVGRLHYNHASVIVSRHYLDRTPPLDEILSIHVEAKRAHADIVKVVGTAQSPADNLPCLGYLAEEPGNVSFAMGVHGVPSRVLSPLMGGAFAYASAGEGAAVAPGQPTLRSLREAYRLMGVSV